MFTLELHADEDLSALIKTRLAKLEQVAIKEDILDEVQEILLQRIRTRFLATEAPDGSKWPPSQAARDRGFNGNTLFDKGNLFHSIQAADPGELERTISTDVFYGIFHQFGTKLLPAREFLGYSDDDISLIEKFVIKKLAAEVIK